MEKSKKTVKKIDILIWELYNESKLEEEVTDNMKKKAPGKGLLQVVGIILVVLAVFIIIGTVINIVMLKAMTSGSMDPMAEAIFEQAGITVEMFRISVILSAVQGVLYLAAGIVGIANCNKVQNANLCFLFGILMLASVLGIQAYNALSSAFSMINIINIIISLILPLLYFWGALKNRQAMMEEQDSLIS